MQGNSIFSNLCKPTKEQWVRVSKEANTGHTNDGNVLYTVPPYVTANYNAARYEELNIYGEQMVSLNF